MAVDGWKVKAAAPLMAALLAVAALGCGSDDDGGASADSNPGSAETANDPQAAIRAMYDEFITALRDRDAGAACAKLTKSAQKEFGTYEAGNTTCQKQLIGLMSPAVGKSKRPEIVELRVKGAKARATVRPAPGEDLTGVRFIEQDGEWKIAGSAVAE